MRETAYVVKACAICKSATHSGGQTERISHDIIEPKIATLKRGGSEIKVLLGCIGELQIEIDAPLGRGRKVKTHVAYMGIELRGELRKAVLDPIEITIGVASQKVKLIDVSKPRLYLESKRRKRK